MDEASNPFVLSTLVKRYGETGELSQSRSENMSYVIGQLIASRVTMNQHRLRRVLAIVAIAMETYSRNELTEEETIRVITGAWGASPSEAQAILAELYASVLRRTANGLAFQMRSYGEYLAAEGLEDVTVDRFKELAFLDNTTPNDSWMNSVSYLAELNPKIRSYFVRDYPLWMIGASPSSFSDEEKTTIVTHILGSLNARGRYLGGQLEINTYRLSRFITPAVEKTLIENLQADDLPSRGNALVLLGLTKNDEAVQVARELAVNRTLEDNIRYCALRTLMNAGGPELVPELLAVLDSNDSMYETVLDTIGSISNESQFVDIIPQLIHAQGMLSNAFYHFREFSSREAVVNVLRFAVQCPTDFDSIRAEGYLEPLIKAIAKSWDQEVADLCAALIVVVELKKVFPNRSGLINKFVESIDTDQTRNDVVRRVFEEYLHNSPDCQRWFCVDQIVAGMLTLETAQWLVDHKAISIIKVLAGYVRGPIRELLRPHSEGLIDAQEEAYEKHLVENADRDSARETRVAGLQQHLFSSTTIEDALKDFADLTKDHWPALPAITRIGLRNQSQSF